MVKMVQRGGLYSRALFKKIDFFGDLPTFFLDRYRVTGSQVYLDIARS